MRILNLEQGGVAWFEARRKYRCASEAPIVMGASRHMNRAELVRMKATGGEKEFSRYVRELILQRGHDVEGPGLALAERVIGESLYPVVGVDDTGVYLASFDGMTMAGEAFEHKLWTEALARQVSSGELDPEYCWQLEHQALVANLDRVTFVCSDGTEANYISCVYRSRPERRKQLVAGWDQFERDVAEYAHVEVLPPPAAAEPTMLPALSIRVDGALALTSNLDVFGVELRAFLDRIPKKPDSDQDFADCEAAIKTLERAESALKAAEESALAQTASVDKMRRTVASLNELARTNRLMIEKLVKARKETIRAEIIQAGRDAFAAHIVALNDRLGAPFMPAVLTDFPGAAKAKKSVQSLRDAVDGELTRAKLLANVVADQIQQNLKEFSAAAGGHRHLFPDLAHLVLKPTVDMVALINQRLEQHERAEESRRSAEREKIRAEEIERIGREQLDAALKKSGAAVEASLAAYGSQTTGTPSAQQAAAPPPKRPFAVWFARWSGEHHIPMPIADGYLEWLENVMEQAFIAGSRTSANS